MRAIGYDMDYTLVDYRVEVFERRVYDFARERLLGEGWPVEDLAFDPEHGGPGPGHRHRAGQPGQGQPLRLREAGHARHPDAWTSRSSAPLYAHTLVDLAEPRWVFLNTLFSLSEGCLFAQMVDLLDQGLLPGSMGYARPLSPGSGPRWTPSTWKGQLKAEIAAAPERYVVLDPETALALLDQRARGQEAAAHHQLRVELHGAR